MQVTNTIVPNFMPSKPITIPLKMAGVLVLVLAGMQAQTFVQAGHCNSGSTTCTITLSVTAGHKLIGCVASTTTTANVLSMTDTQNTYTAATTLFTPSATTVAILQPFWADVSATNGALVITAHVTSSTNFMAATVHEYSGIPSGNQVDQAPAGANISATASLATGTTGTTVQAAELLYDCFATGATTGVTTCTGTGGFTNRTGDFTNVRICSGDQTVAATGTYQGTATASANWAPPSNNGGGLIITFKGATSAAVSHKRGRVF